MFVRHSIAVAHGKVTGEITAIVKDAGHFDDAVLTAAIEKEMSRFLDSCASRSGPAQRKMVRPCPFDQEVGTCLRAWPLRVSFEIEQRVPDEGPVA